MVNLKQKTKALITLFFLSFFISGCASYSVQQKRVKQLFSGQQYIASLQTLEDSNLKDRNRVLYLLEKGIILDRINKRKISQASFLEAKELIKKYKRVSITQTAASFFYNDSATDYCGEVFEQVNLHVMLALSFIEDGEVRKARVEAKQINNKLYLLTKELGKKHNSYRKDAFALYLSGTIFEALEEYDDAIIDYYEALRTYNLMSYRPFHSGGIQEQVAKALYKLAKVRKRQYIIKDLERTYPKLKQTTEKAKGSIVTFHELGNIATKKSKSFLFNLNGELIRFSYPVISSQNPLYGQTGIIINKTRFTKTKNASNLNAIASKTLEEKRLRMVAKGLVRLLIKSQISRSVEKEFGPLAGTFANIITAATEVADTRSWSLLPNKISVTRVDLSPGEYIIKVLTNGKASKEQNITVESNKIVFLRSKSP